MCSLQFRFCDACPGTNSSTESLPYPARSDTCRGILIHSSMQIILDSFIFLGLCLWISLSNLDQRFSSSSCWTHLLLRLNLLAEATKLSAEMVLGINDVFSLQKILWNPSHKTAKKLHWSISIFYSMYQVLFLYSVPFCHHNADGVHDQKVWSHLTTAHDANYSSNNTWRSSGAAFREMLPGSRLLWKGKADKHKNNLNLADLLLWSNLNLEALFLWSLGTFLIPDKFPTIW